MLTGADKDASLKGAGDRLYDSATQLSLLASEPQANYQLSPQQWVEILVDCPGAQGLYTYSIPQDLRIDAGDIVSVPFGTQLTGGIAIRLLTAPPEHLAPQRIRVVEEVITSGFFQDTYWQLLEKVANYYCTDLMSAIRVALPPGLLGRSQRRVKLNWEAIPPGAEAFCSLVAQRVLNLLQGQKDGDYSVNYLRNQVKGASRGIRELSKRGWIENYLEPPKRAQPKLKTAVTLVSKSFLADLTKRQREILQLLKNRGGELWLKELIQLCSTTSATVKKLEERGYVILSSREILRKEQGTAQGADQPKELSPAQADALAVINAQQDYVQILLHGVTGSGKTEVYLQAIAPILDEGKSALVLVPEIGLTPQLTDRFRARFGQQVCVYHSKLSAGERYDTWRQTIQG
ncbi:MAG: DEAD/DEAH box helicase, partial [Cyanobacteria bacterium P01_A01_bin.40]